MSEEKNSPPSSDLSGQEEIPEVSKQDISATWVSQKTQGVKPSRDGGMGVLQSA
jgi:hypothetical protein